MSLEGGIYMRIDEMKKGFWGYKKDLLIKVK